MRSSLSCSSRVSRSPQTLFQGRRHHPTCFVERTRLRYISNHTRQRQHLTGATTTAAKTGQISTHSPIATLKTRPPLQSVSQEALSSSSYDLAPTVPHPENNLSSTRPATLDLPKEAVREVDGSTTLQNHVSYLFQLGKAYLKFYKTGFKNIWYNYKEYQDLRKRFSRFDVNDCIKYGSGPKISRRDFQLYRRTVHDLKKLIPFGLVFAICGEFTPLVIPLLGTAVAPFTCWIPKQVEQNLKKMIERIKRLDGNNQERSEVGISRALAYVHGVDPFGIALRETPILSTPLWRFWAEPKLKQRMDDLICDAILILKEGGAQRLEHEELFQFAIDLRKRGTLQTLIDHQALSS